MADVPPAAPVAEAPATVTVESPPAAAPAGAPSDAMTALEQEMGDAVLPGFEPDEGAVKAPGVSEKEPEEDDLVVQLTKAQQRADAAEEALRVAEANKGKEPV